MTSVLFENTYDFVRLRNATTLTQRSWSVSFATAKPDKQKVNVDDNDGKDFVELPISPPVKLPLPPPEPPQSPSENQ